MSELLANTLRKRLMAKGMYGAAIPAYIRNVANLLATDSLVSLEELNRILHLLGWDDFELDDYTFDLIQAILDWNNLSLLHNWFDAVSDREKVDTMEDMPEALLELERGLFRGVEE